MLLWVGLGNPEPSQARHRHNIGFPVTEALTRCDHESVLLELVRNATAKISDTGYANLVEKSRAFQGLQEPLIKRPDMPSDMANNMCTWVSDALKVYIQNNYHMAPKRVDVALSEANTQLNSEPAGTKDPPADSAQKLIEKLATAGLPQLLLSGWRQAGGHGLPRRRYRQIGVCHRVQSFAPGSRQGPRSGQVRNGGSGFRFRQLYQAGGSGSPESRHYRLALFLLV